MALLCPGALVKLLWNMNSQEKAAVDQRPFLLQIISIVPALGGNDLEPRMGFYVKVSDSSHATYVSLPSTFEEMILNDKLQLGQYIYACELEPASPVPILKGVRPLPGRHPCVGTPEDIVSIDSLRVNSLLTSPLPSVGNDMSIDDKFVIEDQTIGLRAENDGFESFDRSEGNAGGLKISPVDEAAQRTVKKLERSRSVHSSSDSETTVNKKKNKSSGISQSIPCSPVHEFFPSTYESSSPTYEDLAHPASIVMEQCELSNACGIEKQVTSLPARQKSIRRNWEGPFDARTRSRLPRPIRQPKSRRSSVSPSHSHGRNDNQPRKDETLNSIAVKRRDGERTTKLANSLIKKVPTAHKTCKASSDLSVPSKSSNRITKVHWVSVPPSLAKKGKEVSKHRDAALLAAVEALQEASATERLIRCLSTFAELQTLSKESDSQSTVDHFLNLYDELRQAMHIIQSIAKASTPRMIHNKPISSDETDEAFTISLDGKKCAAASWIKAAVVSDLSPLQETSMSTEIVTQREMNYPSCSNKTKGSSLFTNCIKYGEMNTEEAMEREDPKWVKGLALMEASELASSLHSECRTWFLNYIDQCLDQITNKKLSSVSDLQIAGILSQLKRVNDWLDKSESEDATFPSDDDTSSCEKVRKKIYSVLLEHVECTALALENMSLAAPQR